MTKKHFIAAAGIVNNIRTGNWGYELPDWFTGPECHRPVDLADTVELAGRVAEAFIILAQQSNPRFEEIRFLRACGLLETPQKVKKSRAT